MTREQKAILIKLCKQQINENESLEADESLSSEDLRALREESQACAAFIVENKEVANG